MGKHFTQEHLGPVFIENGRLLWRMPPLPDCCHTHNDKSTSYLLCKLFKLILYIVHKNCCPAHRWSCWRLEAVSSSVNSGGNWMWGEQKPSALFSGEAGQCFLHQWMNAAVFTSRVIEKWRAGPLTFLTVIPSILFKTISSTLFKTVFLQLYLNLLFKISVNLFLVWLSEMA